MENVGKFPSEIQSEALQLSFHELEVISNPSLSLDTNIADTPNVIYGRLLSGKSINKVGLKNLFESLWQNKAGVRIDDYSEGIITLTFGTEAVKNRFLRGQPWHFAGSYLITIEADAMTQVNAELFQKIPFWVQVSGIPLGHLAKPYGEILGKEIANSMGEIMEFDPNYRSKFMRFRVLLDTERPLLRGKLLSLNKQKDNIWVSFRYERLSKFCYFCGHLDHIQKDCAALMEAMESGNSTIPQYDDSLKTAGLAYLISPDVNIGKRYDKKLIGQAAMEASRIRIKESSMDANAKRLKVDNIGTTLKVTNGDADEKVGIVANTNKKKDGVEGANNNYPAASKSGHKGGKGSSPSYKLASQGHNEFSGK